MQTPEIPENEEERLKEVYCYDLTNNLRESSYDSITKIASQICNMPVSLITIIDRDRQVFKSTQGLEIDETSRDISFCGHAINNPRELMIISDATKDDRFKDNPAVLNDPNVRFYAGIPILSPDNYPLGTLCVIDSKPNALTQAQQDALKHLGEQVTLLLKLQRKNRLLKESEIKLKKQAEDLKDYAYMVSHDLREPTRMIRSFLELFKKKYGNKIDQKADEYINYAVQGAERMDDLIEGLLHFSKTARLDGSLEPVNLDSLIKKIREEIKLETEDKEVVIKIKNNLPTINGIEIAIRELFYNLIQNALKFTKENESPVVEISSEESETEYIITVKDYGIGIPEDKLSDIFTIFRRLNQRDKYIGNGIGLAIVNKIVDIHKAKIEVKSVLGEFSKFIVRFPN